MLKDYAFQEELGKDFERREENGKYCCDFLEAFCQLILDFLDFFLQFFNFFLVV